MHRDGRSNRAIARDIGLSPPQVGRIVRAAQVRPGVFHDPITSVVVQVGSGAEMGVDDENCNGRADGQSNETRPRTPQSERKPRNVSEQTNESTPITAPTATSSVDNSGDIVDTPPSFWEEAIREGERRRAEELRRRAERERQVGWDRGPPESE